MFKLPIPTRLTDYLGEAVVWTVICDAVPNFYLRMDHQKNFLQVSRLRVCRRKEPILGYVSKKYKNEFRQ